MTSAPSQSELIDVDELRSLLDAKARVTVLDVRTADVRSEWSIPGSVHFDAYDALKAGDPAALADLQLPVDVPVVTVCAAGKASFTAMEQLRKRGYAARSLIGGMGAWSLAWNSAELPSTGGTTRVIQVRRTGKGCLSYLISDSGEAAVIDASLGPEVYHELAAERGWTIRHVLDTHVHADHLSRSRALAEKTGATLHLPETDRVAFPYEPVRDGTIIEIGNANLSALRTPGHTPEATSYLLNGETLFTGDTLFLAGVGRPDLEASEAEARQRAHLLWASLQRLTALPETIVVMPGHTSSPVNFDGEPISATLGEVIAAVAMLHLEEETFVTTILARIPPTPPNHAAIVAFNEAGELPAGDLTELEAGANRCAIS